VKERNKHGEKDREGGKTTEREKYKDGNSKEGEEEWKESSKGRKIRGKQIKKRR
jgi:hypothetical protein